MPAPIPRDEVEHLITGTPPATQPRPTPTRSATLQDLQDLLETGYDDLVEDYGPDDTGSLLADGYTDADLSSQDVLGTMDDTYMAYEEDEELGFDEYLDLIEERPDLMHAHRPVPSRPYPLRDDAAEQRDVAFQGHLHTPRPHHREVGR